MLAKLEDFCANHSWKVDVFTPRNPIAAVSKGAVISEVCEKLLGQRMATASFGIKLEVDGEIVMHWIISRVSFSSPQVNVADFPREQS